MDYPHTRKDDVVDDYFGTPRRRSVPLARGSQQRRDAGLGRGAERITRAFLERLPARDRIHRRLTELWDYARYGVPSREGRWYVFARNDGLQKGPVCR